MNPPVTAGAILLAGGRASRVDGAAKPLFAVGGSTLLELAVTAAECAGCMPITVAGPELASDLAVQWVREDPPFGGPVAGIVAALARWSREHTEPEWVYVLACDLPGVAPAVEALGRDIPLLPADTDGMCLADASSRPQWLIGVYRTAALQRAARALPHAGHGASVRALLDDLAIAVVEASAALTDDVDTWEDLERARRRIRPANEETTVADDASRTLPPEALDDWAEALRERFDLAPEDVPIALILDLARDVANGVARPAAPFSAFVAGLVAGRAGGTPADVEEAARAITELASRWEHTP